MKVFGQSAHWQVNKDLAKDVGIEGALLLSDLFDKHYYFLDKGLLTEKGYFFNTIENIENDTTLTRKLQDKNIKILCEKGYIEMKLMGVPATRHFKINIDKIVGMIQTSLSHGGKQDCTTGATNNNITIRIDNNIVSNDTTTLCVEGEYEKSDITKKIDGVVLKIKNACALNGIVYGNSPTERNYAKHLTGKKFASDCLESVNMELDDFINNIIRASVLLAYGKPLNSAKSIYYGWADVVNKSKKEKTRTQQSQGKVFTLS